MMFEPNTFSSFLKGDSSNFQLTCFICVKPVYEVANEERSDLACYSLVGILNHLKIEVPRKLSNGEDGSLTEVPLCDKCSKVVGKLSGLYRDLEGVKLKINHYLSHLDQLIVLEEKDRHQEHEMTDKQEDSEQKLKRELKQKCSINLEGPTMRVVLTKLDVDTEAEAMEIENHLPSSHQIPKIEVEIPGTDDGDEDYEPGDYEPSDSDSGEELEPEFRREYLTTEENPTTQEPNPTDNSSSSKRKRNPKMFSCSDCDSSFTGKPKLVEHSMVFHPEKYFPPDKMTTSSTSSASTNHNMYLIHLLNTEVDYCQNPKSNTYKCIYCGKLFSNPHKPHSIRMHLIKDHQDILRRELIQLKTEMSEDELKAIVKMPLAFASKSTSGILERNCKLQHFRKDTNSMRREYTCATCGVRTTAPKNHQVIHHPEKVLVKWKKCEDMSSEHFRKYCVLLIDKQVDKIRESQVVCDGKVVEVKCPHCGKIHSEVKACRHHVIIMHKDILGEELKKLQEIVGVEELKEVSCPEVEVERCKVCDVMLTKAGIISHVRKAHPEEHLKLYVNYDCVNCGMGFNSKQGLAGHQEKGERCGGGRRGSRVSGRHICGICKRRFANSEGLTYHYSLSHVDVVLGNVKGREVDGEEWKRWCQEVMKKEEEGLEGVCGESGKMRWKCGYCEETCSSRKLVCVHLVGKHKERLEGKVRRFQEEKEKGGGMKDGGGLRIKIETEREQEEWDDQVENGDGGMRMIVDIKQDHYEDGGDGEETVLSD